MEKSAWPKRLFLLDISRGVASLAVVFWHWQHFAYIGSALPEAFDRTNQPFYTVFRVFYEKGLLGVEYFFLLSGFIFFWLYRDAIADRRVSCREFWIQRFSRLYPLHYVTLIIVAVLQMAYVAQNGRPFVYLFNDLYHFVLNIFFISKWGLEKGWSFNTPAWSVSVEILLYVLFFIAAYIKLGKLFCLSFSVLFFVILQFSNHVVLRGISLFFLGGVVYQATVLLSIRRTNIKALVYGAGALSWSVVITHFYVYPLGDFLSGFGSSSTTVQMFFLHYLLFPSTVCGLALIEIDRGPGFLKSLSWVGDITYSSYLLHFPLQLVLGLSVSYGILKTDFYLNPVSLVAFFLTIICLAYLTFNGFERPVQNTIRTWFQRRAKEGQDAVTEVVSFRSITAAERAP